jgi:amino acid transporter
MRNPQRDVPVAIVVSGVLIAAFYLLGTIGILIALPVKDIGLIEGLLDSLHRLFDEYPGGSVFVTALGVGALFSFLANMVTWTIGANRSAAESAVRGDLPAMFGKLHPRHRTPTSAAILTGVVSTLVICVYGLVAGSAEDLFWTLFSFSTVVFLLPYLLMFAAFVALRRADPGRARPYRVPGGELTAIVLAMICGIFVLQAIALFFWSPDSDREPLQTLAIGIGVIATIIVGELLIAATRRSDRSATKPGGAAAAT